MSGAIMGKFIPHKNPVILCERLAIPSNSIPNKIVPEVIFQKRRNAREIIFAPKPTRSRNPRKREIIMSPIFAKILSG
jgi:hypothetical protein